MEHISAPLGRVLSGIVEAPRFYRSEHGLILSDKGGVYSPAQARELIGLHRDIAVRHVTSDGDVDVRADLIRIRLRMVSELTAAIAAAEAYECEPSVAEVAA